MRRRMHLTLGLVLVLAACKATPPGRLERAVASEVKRRVTVGGTSDRSPLTATDENVRRGQRAFSDDEIWEIVQYLRHLPPAGSLGEPAMYSER